MCYIWRLSCVHPDTMAIKVSGRFVAVKRLFDFLNSGAGALLLFMLGLLIFNWPLLSVTTNISGPYRFCYLFFAWAAIVAVLGLMAYALCSRDSEEEE